MIILFIILILICFFLIFLIFKAYGRNEFNMFGYNFGKYTLGWLFKFYYPYKVIKKPQIPKEGPIIICGNHIHFMDQFLVVLESARPIHFMAKKEYFDKARTRWFFKGTGCIPVNRQIHDANAKELAMEVLEKDLALGIFPEGTRNRTKELLQPFKFGAVSMAKKSNATIIPFAITGNYKFRTKNLKISFGEGFKVGDMSLEEANEKLYNIILKMIKEDK